VTATLTVTVDSLLVQARNSDVLFSIVAFPSDVRAVYLGGNGAKGVLDIMQPGSVVIDMVRHWADSPAKVAAEAAESNQTNGWLTYIHPLHARCCFLDDL